MNFARSESGLWTPVVPDVTPATPKAALPPACECGAPWKEIGADISETCVGYFSPEGHEHDDNCITRGLWCENGHVRIISLQRRCTACDWTGKPACCGPYLRLDAWPDLPVRK